MSANNDQQARFNEVLSHLKALTQWATVSDDDSTLVVDTAELELQLTRYTKLIDELLDIPPTPENRDRLATQIANVWAGVGSVKMVCEDLQAPLNNLLGVLCDEEDDDTSEHDR